MGSWIQWVPSVVSVIIAAIALLRSGHKEEKEDMQKEESRFDGIKEGLIKANMKLDTVCATTNETRTDIKSMTKDILAIDRRVTAVEKDMETAFALINELKGKVGE